MSVRAARARRLKAPAGRGADTDDETATAAMVFSFLLQQRPASAWTSGRAYRSTVAPQKPPPIGMFFCVLLTVAILVTALKVTEAEVIAKASAAGRRITIKHYELLTEPMFGVRGRRSPLLHAAAAAGLRSGGAGSDEELLMAFSAFSRNFEVLLRQDSTIFEPNLKVENSRGRLDFVQDRFYTGVVQDEGGDGTAHGFVSSDDRFRGALSAGGEVYLLEPATSAAAALPIASRPSQPDGHTIIYRLSDVDFNGSHPVEGTAAAAASAACSSESLTSVVVAPKFMLPVEPVLSSGRGGSGGQPPGAKRLTRAASANATAASAAAGNISRSVIDHSRTTCSMLLHADFTFYERLDYDDAEVIRQMTLHMQAANEIFSAIDFDGDGAADGIKMSIKGIKIWDDKNDPSYPYPLSYDAATLLQLFSQQDNYNDYCEAFLFTHRDFSDGTLGIAWTASMTQDGGVCQKNGLVKDVATSLNTGILTTLSYGNEVPYAISRLIFAHEMGHAMGSKHDTDGTSCAPGGNSGNYIMYAKSTDATKPNNNKFSNCSVSLMNTILKEKARSSGGCFTNSTTSLCGNKVVDPGEECDCGWESDCYEDCCVPQTNAASPSQGKPCTLQPWAVCSPTQGSCCTGLCVYEAAGVRCRQPTTCKAASSCTGNSFTCPASYVRQNLTRCTEDSGSSIGVCYRGECTSRLCEANGLLGCQCSPSTAGDWKDVRLCSLCCVDPADATCKLAKVNKTSGVVLGFGADSLLNASVGAGQPCYNSSGYCDAFRVCRPTDPEGPLTQLFSELFSSQASATVTNILNQYWWAAVVAIALLIIGLALFIKFCSRRDVDHLHKELEVVDIKKKKPYSNRLTRLLSRRVAPEEREDELYTKVGRTAIGLRKAKLEDGLQTPASH